MKNLLKIAFLALLLPLFFACGESLEQQEAGQDSNTGINQSDPAEASAESAQAEDVEESAQDDEARPRHRGHP